MQYILTKKEEKIPFYNIRKVMNSDNQPISIVILFRKSELDANGILIEEVLQDSNELQELRIYNDSDILMNTYHGYNRLDEVGYKYDYVISSYVPAVIPVEEEVDEEGNVVTAATVGREEIPEVRDTIVTVVLSKNDDLENKIEDINKTVNAMAVAMAEIMGA